MCQSFFFNNEATAMISTLSLLNCLPIGEAAAALGHETPRLLVEQKPGGERATAAPQDARELGELLLGRRLEDRKSTRLNPSHANISYAAFCLKKKKSCLYHFSSSTNI